MPPVSFKRAQQRFTKKFGEHSLMAASDLHARARIPYGISSQSLSLDLALGRPGFPAGRLTEIVGDTGNGKSTLGYHTLAECQRIGGVAVLFETEHAFEPWRLKALGVDPDALWLVEPPNVEGMFERFAYIIHEVRTGQHFTGPVVIMVDTIADLCSAAEEEGGYDDSYMGVTARAMALGFRKFIADLADSKVVLLFINQLIATMERYGDQQKSYGGSAIHKNASIRIRLYSPKKDIIRVGKKAIAGWTNATFIKNKLADPFRETRYFAHYRKGISLCADLWDAAVEIGAVTIGTKQTTFTLNGKSVIVDQSKWEAFVMEKFKSPAALRERLTKVAIEQGLLRPYGDTK